MHYIYKSRINKDLEEFSDNWRYNPLSSERNQLLYQLWHYSLTRLIHLDPASAKIAGITDWSEYGIDEEAPFLEIDTPNNVKISQSRVSLCDLHMEELFGTISPLVQNEGIDLYTDAVRINESSIERVC